MKYITSTLIEFQRDRVESIPQSLTDRQAERLKAFYYEHYDSFRREGKYIVQYIYYTVASMKKLTRTQMQKQYAAISPQAECSLPPRTVPSREETGVVLYSFGSHPADEELACYLHDAGLEAPGISFADDPATEAGQNLEGLKMAAFYAFRKDALLLVNGMQGLIDNPLFYDVLDEFRIPLRSPDFPWLSRQNLKIMKAITLYKRIHT